MVSPAICYIVSFIVVMLVYLLGWSELYPKLTASVVVFMLLTFAGHLAVYFITRKKKLTWYHGLNKETLPVVGTSVFIFVLWVIEFIYEGGIPLLKILLRVPFDYKKFGVPSLHVFVVTFSSFFTVWLFHLYVSKKSKKILLLYVLHLSVAVLIYSRAMLFFNLTGSLFVYLMSLNKFPYRAMLIVGALIVPMFFFFGVMGSLRASREAFEPYNNENFMASGRATKEFRASVVPKEFFWSYIYITSPLANFQKNVSEHPLHDLSVIRIYRAMYNEILPDFISKRINKLSGTIPASEYRIAHPFNVSTAYSRSYVYAEWTGVSIMALFLIVFPIAFLKIIPVQSDFFVTAWCILCTMYLFASYDNTFRFTGLSFQLVYPVLFYWYFEKKRIQTPRDSSRSIVQRDE